MVAYPTKFEVCPVFFFNDHFISLYYNQIVKIFVLTQNKFIDMLKTWIEKIILDSSVSKIWNRSSAYFSLSRTVSKYEEFGLLMPDVNHYRHISL